MFSRNIIMVNSYLRAFVIGSSFLVFFPYFFAAYNFDTKLINFRFAEYAFIAPVALGMMNMASLFIANTFELSRRASLFIISIVAPICVLFFVKFAKVYNYKTASEWINHTWKLMLVYLVVWNIVVHYLDTYV
jgi:hypothetical protein